jgi:hypothetical protein
LRLIDNVEYFRNFADLEILPLHIAQKTIHAIR